MPPRALAGEDQPPRWEAGSPKALSPAVWLTSVRPGPGPLTSSLNCLLSFAVTPPPAIKTSF